MIRENKPGAGVSVIMPTYNQASFIPMTINSLLNQVYENWELIIINDGCTDDTDQVIDYFMDDTRLTYMKNPDNLGLGKCMNIGISKAKYDYIAYLPSDDIYFPEHLNSLWETFNNHPDAILVFSGIMQADYNVMGTTETCYKRTIKGGILQPVQVMHKKNGCRWMERDERTTDDYSQMYWEKISGLGSFLPTNRITCQWVGHPDQRHKKIQAGLNIYRNFYNVKTPLKFQPKNSSLIDETALYRNFGKKQPKTGDHLKILIVGELSFNPERIYALEEAGHEIYGLWAEKCWWFHTVGPLPFGHVTEVSKENWKEEIERIKPDIIYGLLSAMAVPKIAEVVKFFPHIPFVWHFKESPFYARQNGMWNLVQYLFKRANGIIYINEDIRQFYENCFPRIIDKDSMVFDGELPKKDWFTDKRRPLLSETSGGFHTVVPGRPFGLTPEHIGLMAGKNIHFHFYGESWHNLYNHFIKNALSLAPNHIHLHPACDHENWAEEFSQYDAGWLHYFKSKNHGEFSRTNWEDLNIPARMATLICAGLPLLQRDNTGHIVATQSICRKLGIGIFIKDMEELFTIFSNKQQMQQMRENVWKRRMEFTFDFHVPELIDFFRTIIYVNK